MKRAITTLLIHIKNDYLASSMWPLKQYNKHMKRIAYIFGVFILGLWCSTCSREQAVPVLADFNLTVVEEDYSVPVQVVLNNTTTGAEDYQWSFPGAAPESSVRKNPGAILYKTPGIYTITLKALNRDGSEDTKEITLDLDQPVVINFKAEVQNDNFSPVTVHLTNNSSGADGFTWTFEGGNPATSDLENPGSVVFNTPGDHSITLAITNGRETYTKDTIITVAPFMVSDFDWEVDFQDKDLQVPVKLTMQNQSVSATAYDWFFEGGTPTQSTQENPVVVFSSPGTHRITLTTRNGKETKATTKTITLEVDTNLKVFRDIRFGINTAHNTNQVGSFFSAYTEQIYTKSQLTADNGPVIDLVFFGLNDTFSFNRFYAPDTLGDTTFDAIPGATHTKMINVQEGCGCGASLSVVQFSSMIDDALLRGLTITETLNGLQPFDNSVVPRIVLFETADGRKGAIHIKRFVPDGANSYIETDIKIQKQKRK